MTALPFFENAGDAVAVFALHLFAEPFHDLFEPLDVTAGLFEVGFERIPENRRMTRPSPSWGAPCQLFLCVVGIAEFIEKRVVERTGFGHG